MDEPIASVEVKELHSNHNQPRAALTPPTSEEWNKDAVDGSDELSDLDIDEEEEDWEIEPDHYYGSGRVPIFKPTMEQFRDFQKLIAKIDKYGMKSGIVKVIPPQEWRDSLPALDQAIKDIRVKNPITQEFSGQHGTYTQANIEKQRSYNLPQWKSLTEETQHQPPARRGEKRKHQEKAARPAPRSRPAPTESADGQPIKRRGRPPKKRPAPPAPINVEKKEEFEEEQTIQAPPTPTSPVPAAPEPPKRRRGRPPKTPHAAAVATVKNEDGMEDQKRVKEKTGGRQPRMMTISERRKYNRQEKVEDIDEAAFEGFDYRFDAEEFTAERCAELEEKYWKSITFAPPIYGADMPGSLFDESTSAWNVSKLPNLLDVIGQKVPGVNTAYLYLGMWKATFAWHLEDVDLYSINYIHFGAPKQWYSISQEDARRFENAMKSIWPTDAKNCSQFLRHKTYLISPALLKSQFNIEVNKLVHYEGEFVITYPYGYHSGYNLGYNCAESVNFATEGWLDFGKIAKKCDCEADSVWINVEDIERKLRGEPTPEYYEETDDEADVDGPTNLPSPPASVIARKAKTPGRKRKRESLVAPPVPERQVKKIKIRIRASNAEPCVLCPNHYPSEPLLQTDTGRHAHRVCALYTPETYLSISEESGVETVLGVANIDKARLDLKCSFCRSRKGACFQCSSRKCTRAFHATCAAPGGVQVEYGPVPVYGEDGTEYVTDGYDFRCRFHRARRAKNVTIDALEMNTLIRRFAKALQQKETVQAQYLQGEVFAGTVVENRVTERAVVLDILPDGDRVEVEWKYLTVLDPADSQLPKPTADAKPLPAHMNGPAAASRNLEFGPPLEGDHFCDPAASQKWAEFNTAPAPHNPYQVKVDLEKKDQLWFYLERSSTEARAQFTEDPFKRVYNSSGNFLDTIKAAAPTHSQSVRTPMPVGHPTGATYSSGQGVIPSQPSQAEAVARPYQYKPRLYANITPVTGMAPLTPTSMSSPLGPPSHGRSSFSGGQLPASQLWNTSTIVKPSAHRSASLSLQTPMTASVPITPAPVASMGADTTTLTPATPQSSADWLQTSKDYEFVKRIQPYRYLVNSYCRRPKIYRSPYAAEGGFSTEYVKALRQDTAVEQLAHSSVYQECSIPLATYKPALAALQQKFPQSSTSMAPVPRKASFATQLPPYNSPSQPPPAPPAQAPRALSTYGQYQTSAQFEQQMKQEQQQHQLKEKSSYDRLMAQIASSARRAPDNDASGIISNSSGIGNYIQALNGDSAFANTEAYTAVPGFSSGNAAMIMQSQPAFE